MTSAIIFQGQNNTYSFAVLCKSIEESFTSIDRFEFQVAEELRVMRDDRVFEEGGYTSFEEFCNEELSQWGGYRRVNQLLGAQTVVEALKETSFNGAIKRESHARPLLRLVKSPEKLQEAVAIASASPNPTAKDFAEAAKKVSPLPQKKPKVQEQLFLEGTKVRVSSQSHPRYGEEGAIASYLENSLYTVVFADGEIERAYKHELSTHVAPPPERIVPPEYTEAIAQLKLQHQEEINRLKQELATGLKVAAEESAKIQWEEQLKANQQLLEIQAQKIIDLQQRIEAQAGLQQLEEENRQLRDRLGELERALKNRPVQEWGNTFTKQAEKVLSKEVKIALENTIDLRSLAQEPPKDNADECLSLMGLALKNIAIAMNSAQALEAAAILLGKSPLILQATSQIREVLQSGGKWEEFWAIACGYEEIKREYWRELTVDEREIVTRLKKEFDNSTALIVNEEPQAGLRVGAKVSHSDSFSKLYEATGTITSIENDMALVHWDGCDRPLLQHRYELHELRIVEV